MDQACLFLKRALLCCHDDPPTKERTRGLSPKSIKIANLPDEAAYRTAVEASFRKAAGDPSKRYKKYGNNIMDGWYKEGWTSDANIKAYADTTIGFGKTKGGKEAKEFTLVTDPSDDGKKKGTLRYICMNTGGEPTWVRFSDHMHIKLEDTLDIPSNITIDGRGHRIEITGGMLRIEGKKTNKSNIILTRLIIRNVKTTGKSGDSLGYALYLSNAKKVVMDHLHLENCEGVIKPETKKEKPDPFWGHHGDGKLIDLHDKCTDITISNCVFTKQYFNVLCGAHDIKQDNKDMRVTLAYCYFGPNNVEQRMPRCREGTFHIVNNFFDGFRSYSIGGSDSPAVLSENNVFRPHSSKKKNGKGELFVTLWQEPKKDEYLWDDTIAYVKDVGSIFHDGCSFEDRGSSEDRLDVINYDRSWVIPAHNVPRALRHAGLGKPLHRP